MPTAYANPSYDGFIRKYGGAFSGLCATGTVTGNDAGPSSANDYIAEAEPSNPMVYRGFWQFLASDLGLPAGAVVTGVRIGIWVYAKSSGGGGTTANNSVAIVESTIPDDTAPAVGYYGNVGSTELCSRVDLSTLTTGAYKEITLNATGIALAQSKLVDGTGRLKLAMRIGHDLDAHTPTGNAYWQGYWADQSGTTNDPYIVVDYVVARTASDTIGVTDGSGSVQPQAAVSASDSAAVTDTAGAVVLVRPYGTPVAQDSCAGTAGTNLESHAPTNGAWTKPYAVPPTQGWKIGASGNRAVLWAWSAPASNNYKLTPTGGDTDDMSIEVEFTKLGSAVDYVGLIARYTQTPSFYGYEALLSAGGYGASGTIRLDRVVAGSSTTLGSYSISGGVVVGTTYRLKVEASGSTISVYLDGVLVIQVTDATIASGGVGVAAYLPAATSDEATSWAMDNVAVYTGSSYWQSDSAAVTDTASASVAPTPVSASDSATGTDAASVGSVATSVSASESVTGTDSSAVTRFVSTRPGTAQTRAASGSPVTLFPSNGSAGTYGSHYGLPDGIMLSDGTLMVVARKSGGHSVFSGSARGRIVAKTKPPGGSWSAEATILDTAYDERDPCLGLLADGTVCLTWNRLDLDGKAYNGDNGDTKFYAPFMKCPAGADPLVAANWTTPVNTTGSGLANNWRVGTDILELTPGGRILVALYGTPTYPPWVDDECWIAYSDDGGTTWGMLSQLDSGDAHSLSSSGEPQLVRCGDGSILACYRTIASPWETWARRSTDEGATWSAEWRIATNSINKTGMVRTPDGDVIIAFNNASDQLTIAQSFDEGATFTTTVLGNTGNLYAQPFYYGTQGVTPNAAVVYSYETSGQTISSVYFQELTAGATPAVSLSDSATATDTASVTVSVGVIAKTATDAATTTDTAIRSAITLYVTASDSILLTDSSGNDTGTPALAAARIVRDTYVTSTLFGAKTVSSSIFGDRTVYVHPDSTIEFS